MPLAGTQSQRAVSGSSDLRPSAHSRLHLEKASGMTNDLTGSTALITGGTSGIGRAAALSLARLGAHVVLSGRDAARGQQVAAAIRAEGGRADFVAADLGDEASARQLARQATELGDGHVDILVN